MVEFEVVFFYLGKYRDSYRKGKRVRSRKLYMVFIWRIKYVKLVFFLKYFLVFKVIWL